MTLRMENKTSIHTVDDDETLLDVIKYEFKDDEDYNFVFFSKPVDFMSSLRSDLDLIVMDVNMPEFDVVEAVKIIDVKCPWAYVIIISAESDSDTLVKLLNLGVFRFCEKDGLDFLPRLREYIKAAHAKITFRKETLKQLQ
jgi:DNA-binding NtrC family response regulator